MWTSGMICSGMLGPVYSERVYSAGSIKGKRYCRHCMQTVMDGNGFTDIPLCYTCSIRLGALAMEKIQAKYDDFAVQRADAVVKGDQAGPLLICGHMPFEHIKLTEQMNEQTKAHSLSWLNGTGGYLSSGGCELTDMQMTHYGICCGAVQIDSIELTEKMNEQTKAQLPKELQPEVKQVPEEVKVKWREFL